MILRYSYIMRQSYSLPVVKHYYALKAIPHDTHRQRIIKAELDLNPDGCRRTKSDIFGNKIIYGTISEAHTEFNVRLSGIVETGLACNEHTENKGSFNSDIFRCASTFTKPGTELQGLYSQHYAYAKKLDSYTAALYLMRIVYHTMSYVPGVTDISTTAEEALRKRRGVCQDYAHILIALCRMFEIPARYIAGMMVGEGASHAWAEVCCNGFWYGLDPTNNLLVDEGYIKLAQGRDYADTVILKGVFYGCTSQTQEINVTVLPQQKGMLHIQ